MRSPRSTPEKPQDRKKVLLRLWSYLRRYPWMVTAALLLTLTGNLLALYGPLLSGKAINAIGSTPGGVEDVYKRQVLADK